MHYLAPIVFWIVLLLITLGFDIVVMTPVRRKVSLELTCLAFPVLASTFLLSVSLSVFIYFGQ